MKTGDDEMGRYGGSMYFSGYRDAKTWADMGLIGDRLSFTDDDVITNLTQGKTERLVRSRCLIIARSWRH